MLQFLRNVKAHTLAFSVSFQHKTLLCWGILPLRIAIVVRNFQRSCCLGTATICSDEQRSVEVWRPKPTTGDEL